MKKYRTKFTFKYSNEHGEHPGDRWFEGYFNDEEAARKAHIAEFDKVEPSAEGIDFKTFEVK